MKNKITLAVLTAVLAVLLICASVFYKKLGSDVQGEQITASEEEKEKEEDKETSGSDGQEESEQEPSQAPDFTVTDSDGKKISLSDQTGKPVVVNFWASWCGPCKSEMPEFESKYQQYKDEIEFMMVNMTDGQRETKEAAERFIKDGGYTFPVYYDTDIQAAEAYAVYSIPATYFLDAKGRIIAQGSGALDGDTIQKGIDMIYENQ